MVVKAEYTSYFTPVQVVQYYIWLQSHLIINLSFSSGEALHFEYGTSPSFFDSVVGW